jgi:hypothetical protein
MRRVLPDYRLLTTVDVEDGCCTTFWHDCWLAIGQLTDALPTLYTCAVCSKSSVECDELGAVASLCPMPVCNGHEEFTKLSKLLTKIILTDELDVRWCPWEDKAHSLSSSTVYKAVVSNGTGCEYYKFIWENCATLRVKFFGWLLIQNRIQTKKNLLKKHCVDFNLCELCSNQVESAAHLIAGWPFTAGLWNHIRVVPAKDGIASL